MRETIRGNAALAAAVAAGGAYYLEPGDYELKGTVRPARDLDLFSPEARIRVDTSPFWPDRPTSFRLEGLHFDFRGSTGTSYVVALAGANFPIPRLEAHHCMVTGDQSGGLFGYLASDVPDRLHVGRVEVTSTTLLNVSRGLALQCSIGLVDVRGLTVDGFLRFGVLLGPLREWQQGRMERMTLRDVHVSRGTRHSGPNHACIYLAGRNVLMERFSAVGLGDGTESDTEGVYTKVDGLELIDGVVHNAGGNQALVAIKGAPLTSSGTQVVSGPFGSMPTVRRVVVSVDSGRAGTGIWLQADGPTLLEDVHCVGLSEPAFKMHKDYRGPVTFRRFREYGNLRRMPALRLRPGPDPSSVNVFRFERCHFEVASVYEQNSAMIETDGRNSWEIT